MMNPTPGVPWRTYDPLRTANRLVAYNRHSLSPRLSLPSRTAWYLAHVASQRRMEVSALIVEVLSSWSDSCIDELDAPGREAFYKSIPHYREPYRK